GGGRANFLPVTEADPEYPDKQGRRTDGRHLINEWLAGGSARTYVWNQGQFATYQVQAARQLLGLFEPSHLQFEADRSKDPAGEPSLTDMTRLALSQLQKNDSGYFLLVESGRIDHAHHFSNAYRALTDTVEFANAIAAAVAMVDLEKTLILVTADHSHTLTISGYPERGNPILGKVVGKSPLPEVDAPPYTTLGYANGPGYQASYPDLSQVDTTHKDYRQIAAVPLAVETHAGEDVAAYATGLGAEELRGVMEQNELFVVIRDALFR
ncbi:MAG: alkaline phosphatase, partial [Pseudomonadota bacterium]